MSSSTPTNASPSSTTSLTFIPTAATPSSHNSTLRIVATIVPIVVIVAITLWGLLVAGGILHHQRGQLEDDSLPAVEINEKWPDGEEPKLWEVSLESISAADYHDALHVRLLGLVGSAKR